VRLLFVTGSRGEWGYIRPVLRRAQKVGIQTSVCATNMHLLPQYGLSIDAIRQDGFEVSDQIYMAVHGDNHFAMTKSLGLFLISFVDVLARVRPDWILVAGDRGEQLMAAIAGAYTYIPVAHIQAGELSGNIDGITRHAVGKFAHVHFASNDDAAKRLLNLGEEGFRVHLVGAPQLDELVEGRYTSLREIEDRLALDLRRPYLLVVQHPVTDEYERARAQIEATCQALRRFDMTKVCILSNNDAGAEVSRRALLGAKHGRMHIFDNLRREDYLGVLRHAACIVGNSSSGLIEAPTFGVPAVNLGTRQADRVQGRNVINAPFDIEAIVAAIEKGCSPEFRRGLRDLENPYGDGRSSERIVSILESTPKTAKLLSKRLTY
jgi:GDP/UDP-N,N'-diacetylbacillosamine 2-epimerase (hydrolysing)